MSDTDRKLVDNVGDPEQVKQGRTKASLLERRQRDRWQRLLDTADGRAVVWEILEECGVFRTAFGASDAETNHMTGKQAIGHTLLARIHQAKPHALVEMMLENAKERDV